MSNSNLADVSQFPVKFSAEVTLKGADGRMATLSGAEFIGHIPTKAELLKMLGDAVVLAEEQTGQKFTVPAPTEVLSEIASGLTGVKTTMIAPRYWLAFTAEELGLAVTAARAEAIGEADAELDEEDDDQDVVDRRAADEERQAAADSALLAPDVIEVTDAPTVPDYDETAQNDMRRGDVIQGRFERTN